MDKQEIEHRIAYSQGQLQVWSCQITLAQTEVLSGAYKLWDIASFGGRQFSDEEKLQEGISRIRRHLDFMRNILDGIGQLQEQLRAL